MTDTTDTAAAQTPSDGPDGPDAPDTPAAEGTAACGQPGPADDPADTGEVDEHQGDADTFPRDYVEKLRRESATLRDRAKAAEQAVEALQRQAAEQQIRAAGLKPAAVWAVAQLGDVVDDHGAIDPGKLGAAMGTARQQLGIRQPAPAPGRAGLKSGSGVPHEKPRGFAEAFGPNNRNR